MMVKLDFDCGVWGEVDGELVYVISVERVLQIEDFKEVACLQTRYIHIVATLLLGCVSYPVYDSSSTAWIHA